DRDGLQMDAVAVSASLDEKGRPKSSTPFLRVHYVRPWYRSPAILSAIGVIALILPIVFQVTRVQRRNKLVKRRFNPYIAGAPVLDNDLFLGRDALVDRILQTVHNNSILLYGERRI